jgi:DNA-binding MarR family transcriptional regulator
MSTDLVRDAAEHRALSGEEEVAWRRYYRMQSHLLGVLNRELTQASGLSEAEYEVSAALLQQPGHKLRARELRRELLWEKSRLSHQLRRMEQRGLIRRTDCAEDSRGAIVELTAAGRRIVVQAECARVSAIRTHLIGVLSENQLAALSGISETVLHHLGIACAPHLDG